MRKIFPYIIIVFLGIVACWQVSFFAQTLKYDILDGYLPGHYFMSECLHNNVFPLWNPYQQLGFPIYADLTNTNYVVDMWISRLFPYTNITFHILFVLYLIIAGAGTYKLSKRLGVSDSMSLLTGISYMLSGFFISNAQHIQFIISAAWLPWVLYAFLKLIKDPIIKHMLVFVIITSLFISGGYPSLAIVLAYLLAAVMIAVTIKYIREKKYRQAVLLAVQCAVAAILLLMMSSGIILSIIQSTPYVGRFSGLSYETSVNNSFTPKSLISLIAPLAPAEYPQLFRTDVSMNNIYFGAFVFLFFIYALFRTFNYKSVYLLMAGLVILLISFGDHFFVHRILYDYIPLFNKFRHPSALRIFTILFILLFTGIQVTRYNPAEDKNFRTFRSVYLTFFIVISATCLISLGFIVKNLVGPVQFKAEWNSLLKDFGITGPLFLQTALFLVINLPFAYFVVHRKNLHLFSPLAVATIILEIMVFTQINLPYTVVSKYNPFEMRRFLRTCPSGFPLPDNRVLAENTDESVAYIPLIHNTNTYSKTVSADARYPFYLNGFIELNKDSLLMKKVMQNRMLYFGDTIVSLSSTNKKSIPENRKPVVFPDSVYHDIFNSLKPQSTPEDTIVCTSFSPSRFDYKTYSPKAQIAVLIQNNYSGWKVYIDNKITRHYTVNRTLIGVIIPAGKHDVVYEYSNHEYQWATIGSFGLFFALLLLFFVLRLIERWNSRKTIVYATFGIVFIVLIPVLLAWRPVESYAGIQERSNEEISNHLQTLGLGKEKTLVLLNTESLLPFQDICSGKQFIFERFRKSSDLKNLNEMLDTSACNRFVYVWQNVTEPPELRDIIQMHFPLLSEQYAGKKYALQVYCKDTVGGTDNIFCNNYEHEQKFWSYDGIVYDSNMVFSGKFSEKLTHEREYSATFRYKTNQIPRNGFSLFASVRFHAHDITDCYLVIGVNRHGKNRYYYSLDLSQYYSKHADWNMAFTSQQWLKSSLRKGDEILVYCWNKGRNEAVYLDDFCIKIK